MNWLKRLFSGGTAVETVADGLLRPWAIKPISTLSATAWRSAAEGVADAAKDSSPSESSESCLRRGMARNSPDRRR